MTDPTSNTDVRERLAAHLVARREERTMRLELADNLFLVAIDTLEEAAKLRTIDEGDAPKARGDARRAGSPAGANRTRHA